MFNLSSPCLCNLLIIFIHTNSCFNFSCFVTNKDKRNSPISSFLVLEENEKIFHYMEGTNFKHIRKVTNANRNVILNLVKLIRQKSTTYYNGDEIDANFEMLTEQHEITDKLFPIKTKGDGNCFFYSISKVLFGSDIQYKNIRLGVIFVLLEYEKYFKRVIKVSFGSDEFSKIVQSVAKDKNWANEYMLLATAIVLNRPLICLTIEKKCVFSHEYCVNKKQKNNQQIHVALKNFHFVPLLPKKELKVHISAKQNQFEKIKLYKIKLY